MGSVPTKPSRKEGIFFDDLEATSPDVSEDENEKPDQPHEFKFSEVSCNSFTVSWKSSENFDVRDYQLRIFPPEGIKSQSLINELKQPFYTFDKLCSGTRYTVGVVAVDSNKRRSTCASASESTLPQPPTDIDFPDKEITSSTFRVRWRAPKGDREFYDVNLSPTIGVTGMTSVSNLLDTSYVYTGLVPGTKYNVKVVSVANSRQSKTLERDVITNPGHVYDLTFPSVTHNEMNLVWKRPPGVVDCYTLKLTNENEIGDPVIIQKIKQTSYKFNGLVTGRNYHCEIFTHAHGKTSVRKMFDQCTIPSEVSNLSVGKVTLNEAEITWSNAPGDFEDYDLYLLPREGVIGDTCPRGIIDNSYKFTGLLPGTKYTVGVVTNSKDKMSQRVVTGFLTEPSPCGEITFPSEELKSTQIGIHWLPSRGECDSYSILVVKDGGTGGSWKIEDLTQPRQICNDLTPGAEYTFSISSLREGRHSASVSASCSTLPCPAGIIEFPVDGITTNSIKIAWHPSAGGVDSYKIIMEGGGTKAEDYAKYDTSEYTIKNLVPGTKYDIFVSVISFGVESEPSTASATTGPDQVKNLSVETINKREIRVTWSPPDGGVDYYDLTIRPTADIQSEADPRKIQTTVYIFERLVPGTLYNITVTPIAREVRGNKAEIDGYTLPGDILNVHFPTDCVTTDSMKVVWGVEGNSKDVLTTLLMIDHEQESEQIEPILTATLDSVNEHIFNDLKPNTKYTVKLHALGSKDLASAGGELSTGATSMAIQETQGHIETIEPETTTIDIQETEAVTETIEQSNTAPPLPSPPLLTSPPLSSTSGGH